MRTCSPGGRLLTMSRMPPTSYGWPSGEAVVGFLDGLRAKRSSHLCASDRATPTALRAYLEDSIRRLALSGAGVVVRRSDDGQPGSELLRGSSVGGGATRCGAPTTAGVPGRRGEVLAWSQVRTRSDAVHGQQAGCAVADDGGQFSDGHDAGVDARGDVTRSCESPARQRGGSATSPRY